MPFSPPEHIFADERPFRECHAATLVELPDGRFLVAWFGGTHEKHPDVGIWGATRSAGEWTPPRLLAKIRESPHWNPVLFLSPEGQVHLFFKVGDEIPIWETWRIISADGGETWSEPAELVPGDRGGRGPVKNKPILLSDGAWLAPASLEKKVVREDGARYGVWDAFTDRSDDAGCTWQASPLVPLDHAGFAGAGVIQPTLWESGGSVHMLLRSTMGRICRSDSVDGGRTWAPVYPTDLPNNNSGLDLARLPDGRLVLVYNPVPGDWAARTPLSVAVSSDDGATWRRVVDLETAPGEYSYPAVIPTRTGVAVAYTWRREHMCFWQASAEDL